jgi:hypothetical protein
LTTASLLGRARVSRTIARRLSPVHPEVRRSPLGDSGSIPRCGSTLDAAARSNSCTQQGAVVSTEDTLYFGFGFEGITDAATRADVMEAALDHFLS